MNYTEFVSYIADSFRKLMGDRARIDVKTIIKNNDCIKDVLVILKEGEKISPSIYLDSYFKDYQRGISLHRIISGIYTAYREYCSEGNISFGDLSDFTAVKDSIVYKLVNRDRNKRLLTQVPYVEYLDLAIVFYFIVNNNANTINATAMINNNHLTLWDVTREDIFKLAVENTPRLLGSQIAAMDTILRDLAVTGGCMGMELPCPKETGDDVKMHVLTNSIKLNGAACILYKGLLKSFSEKVGGDFFIIPSSIHEVILVSDKDVGVNELNLIIKQVNEEELEAGEVLSDHVYRYIQESDEIIIGEQ